MVTITSTISSWNIKGKRVFLRIDCNVPIKSGRILNDYRLEAILPTLNLLLEKGGHVIIAGHIGRPTGFDLSLSTRQLIPWLENKKYSVIFAPNIRIAKEESKIFTSDILLLENLRFFPGEKSADENFAKELAACADFYVDDAFGTLHRHDTSIALLPEQFDTKHKSIGLLVEKELQTLSNLLSKPKKPYVLILGGGKVCDKLALIESCLDVVDAVLVCPAIAFTFLKTQGYSVGRSLIDREEKPEVKKILEKARQKNIPIILPEDFIVAENDFSGPLRYTTLEDFPENGVGITIGKKTETLFVSYIKNAGTIFYNGLMGSLERKETLSGAKILFTAISQSSATTIIAGGDSIGAVQEFGLADKFTFLSTGGGATLTYLSGKMLPGIEPFLSQ